MSQFVYLEEGTSGISNSSSTGRESTIRFCQKVLLLLVKISPYLWCANKISIEPFFLYGRVLNYDTKCVELDDMLTSMSIFLSRFNTLFIIGTFAFWARGMLRKKFLARLMEWRAVAKAMKLRVGLSLQSIIWLYLLVNDLSSILSGEGGSLTSSLWPDGSIFFLLRYFSIVILLYIMFTRDTRIWATRGKAIWAKATFNLLLYIHGGHVFGGLWYAFAIEKEIECWNKACKHYASKCPPYHDFTCRHKLRDYKFINEFCPTKTRNTTVYDFGIYHDALESGIVEMWNLPRRVLYCFRWGLQNLSGFGQNIQTSTDAWENIFVISITIYGMVLFVFFIGNMQIYLQSQTNRSGKIRQKKLEMIRQEKQEVERSNTFQKLPKNLQKRIIKWEKWEETEGGVAFGNWFNKLPGDLSRIIKRELCLDLLKQVEEFRTWSEELLHELCDCAKPVYYAEQVEIVRRGSSIDKMLFLVRGNLQTYSLLSVVSSSVASPSRSGISINHLEDGEFCGEELVAWMIRDYHRDFQDKFYSPNLPISEKTIQTTTKVDAFALMYYDLQNVFSKHQTAYSTSIQVQEPQPPQAPPSPSESLAQQPTSGI